MNLTEPSISTSSLRTLREETGGRDWLAGAGVLAVGAGELLAGACCDQLEVEAFGRDSLGALLEDAGVLGAGVEDAAEEDGLGDPFEDES